MIKKEIQFCFRKRILACDGKCYKAWGMNSRSTRQLSEDIDDYFYFADNELGMAPIDPGTYEGCFSKPEDKQLNKWCARM